MTPCQTRLPPSGMLPSCPNTRPEPSPGSRLYCHRSKRPADITNQLCQGTLKSVPNSVTENFVGVLRTQSSLDPPSPPALSLSLSQDTHAHPAHHIHTHPRARLSPPPPPPSCSLDRPFPPQVRTCGTATAGATSQPHPPTQAHGG